MIELSEKDARELWATELDALGFTDDANFKRNDKLCGEDVAARNAIQAAFAEGARRAAEQPAAKAENAPAQPTPQPQCDCLEVLVKALLADSTYIPFIELAAELELKIAGRK